MPEKFYVAGKAVIVRRGKALILACEDKYEGAHWDLPGGRMERNESLEDALVREVKEELPSISEISITRHLHTFTMPKLFFDGTPGVWNVFQISAKLPKKVELSPEHIGYRWVTKDEVLNIEKINKRTMVEGYRRAILLALE